jgi:YD repeat-containing protein
MLTVQDEENKTTAYGYDAASQLLTVTDQLSQITRYSYDLAGNKTSQKDARGNTTSYVWDMLLQAADGTLNPISFRAAWLTVSVSAACFFAYPPY